VPAHRAGTANGWAAATYEGRGANAKTCSTCQRRVLTPVTVVKGCDRDGATLSGMRRDHQLFDRHNSCLLVIDVQRYFLDKLQVDQQQPLVARIAWLMRVARLLDIPIIATAEDIANDGLLVAELLDELPEGTAVHDKMIFGLTGQKSILDDVEHTGRADFVIVGLETDVCVAHSTIGLLERGHRVAVIDDATASPPPHHEYGIARAREAGAVITSVKGIYYEWVRDLVTMHRIRPHMHTSLPPGLTL
jgi:nicotinamidase-related amidase